MKLDSIGASPHGVLSYAKSRIVSLDEDWRADVAVLGVPFDLGTGYRVGARFGPKAIRDRSTWFKALGSENPGYLDLRTGRRMGIGKIVDCEDVEIVPMDWEGNFQRTTDSVRKILDHGAMPLVLGGDHSVTFPVVRAYEGCKPITIVHFDAHIDYRDEYAGVTHAHGNVLRRCSELACVDDIIAIGIRSSRFMLSDVEAHIADGHTMVCAWDIHDRGPQAFRDKLPSGRDVYVTFDVDVLDPSIAPGTGTAEVGGLSYQQARWFLEAICEENTIVGFDMVEVNPHYDQAEITSLVANQLIAETLGFLFPGERCLELA